MFSAKYSPVSVTEQPRASHDLPMDLKAASMEPLEKGCNGHDHNHHSCSQQRDPSDSHHHRCHNGRLRRFLVPFLIAFLLIGGLVAYGCATGHSGADVWGLESLVSRAVGDGTTDGSGNNDFVHRKLYLIVVFVGLFVVLVLAIMLSAWCCRGAFENPCCCPCYLCACCGGLACLECIGCGLCAEGLSQA